MGRGGGEWYCVGFRSWGSGKIGMGSQGRFETYTGVDGKEFGFIEIW